MYGAHNKVNASFGLGKSCCQASHCQHLLGASPHLLKLKIPALSFEELGEPRHGHVEVVLLYKCQLRTENVCYGRFQEGEKLDWTIWKISGKRWD